MTLTHSTRPQRNVTPIIQPHIPANRSGSTATNQRWLVELCEYISNLRAREIRGVRVGVAHIGRYAAVQLTSGDCCTDGQGGIVGVIVVFGNGGLAVALLDEVRARILAFAVYALDC